LLRPPFIFEEMILPNLKNFQFCRGLGREVGGHRAGMPGIPLREPININEKTDSMALCEETIEFPL
jgi:hypothetical protein